MNNLSVLLNQIILTPKKMVSVHSEAVGASGVCIMQSVRGSSSVSRSCIGAAHASRSVRNASVPKRWWTVERIEVCSYCESSVG